MWNVHIGRLIVAAFANCVSESAGVICLQVEIIIPRICCSLQYCIISGEDVGSSVCPVLPPNHPPQSSSPVEGGREIRRGFRLLLAVVL